MKFKILILATSLFTNKLVANELNEKDSSLLKFGRRIAYSDYLPLTGGILTGALTGTTASFTTGLFNGAVALTGGALVSSYPAVYNQTTQGSNPAYGYFQNTGGLLYSGREGSGGGALLTSASPYASVINSTGAYPLHIGVNSSIALTLTSSGAATFANSVSLGGALISSYPAVYNQTTQGMNPAYGYFQNSGGFFYSGREGSGGGALLASASPYASVINSTGAYPLQIGVNNAIALTLASSGAATFTGNVGIGTASPTEKLSVVGNALIDGDVTTRKVTVTQSGWPDYVFHFSYSLKPLSEVAQYIKENNHLPEVPSAKEVEKNGVNVGDNQALLLKKIEELTLYLIQQDEKIKILEKKLQNR